MSEESLMRCAIARTLWFAAALCLLVGCTAPSGTPNDGGSGASSGHSVDPSAITVSDDYVAVARGPIAEEVRQALPLTAPPADRSYVIGPHYSLGLDGIGAVAELPAQTAAALHLPAVSGPALVRAGTGHELLLAHLPDKSGATLNGDEGVGVTGYAGDSVSVKVQVAQAKPVDLGTVQNGSLIVVSVPTGADALLTVDDVSNHPQSLRMRAGVRADTNPALRPPQTQQLPTITGRLSADLYTLGRDIVTPTFELSGSLTKQPWDANLGWAAAGHDWLIGHLSMQTILFVVKLDVARSFAVKPATGGTLHPRPATVNINPFSPLGGGRDFVIAFDVPATFSKGTFNCTLAGTYQGAKNSTVRINVVQPKNTRVAVALPN
jgi:hypothetical protein